MLCVPLGDARLRYDGGSAAPDDVARWLGERYPQAVIVMTLGAEGALARRPKGDTLYQRAFTAEPVGRVGDLSKTMYVCGDERSPSGKGFGIASTYMRMVRAWAQVAARRGDK